ncbi:hypothetical protein SLA2020_485840 [Shorea laevis]
MAEMGRECSGMDNFSRLPDELVLCIISLLPMKDAVRTSILSSRWRYLYASSSNLDFDLWSNDIDFVEFVDRVFFLRKRCPINRFRLRICCTETRDSCVSRIPEWIIAVMRLDVRELELSLDTELLLLLPPSLFTCETLVVLKLSICPESGEDGSDESSLKVPANVCLPSLKVLHLVDFTFSDDCRKRLFSNCPVLEDLKCSFKESNWKCVVCNPTLKRLTITSSDNPDGKSEIVVDAPGLDYLELSVWDVYSCTFLNIEALAKADISFLCHEWEDYDENYENAVANLMKAISNIQTFRICGLTLSEFNYFDIPNPGFNNVTHLTIASCKECGFPELQYILLRCESLETLVLEDSLGHEWDPAEGTISWPSPQEQDEINCLSFCVKKIVLLWFEGSEVEIELAKYFLQSAEVLESMEIHIKAGYQDQLEITKELLRLPRASNECIVDIV